MISLALAAMVFAAGEVGAPSVADLRGHWVSECQAIGEQGRHGVVTSITIGDDSIEAETQMFATNTCKVPTFKLAYTGRATVLANTNGALAFNHMVQSIILTAQVEDVVAQYNQGGDHGCGLTGWQVNVPKFVAGQRCKPFSFPTAGTTLYDAAWIDGDQLRLGSFPMLWDNAIAEKRPTRPLPTVYWRAPN